MPKDDLSSFSLTQDDKVKGAHPGASSARRKKKPKKKKKKRKR